MTDLFKLANQLGNKNQKPNNNQGKSSANFLETFKDQAGAATTGMVSNAYDQLFGGGKNNQYQDIIPQNGQVANPNTLANPNQLPFNFAEFLKLREQQIRQQERNLTTQQRRTETVIFHQKEEKAKQEIEFIKCEIKKIINTAENISGELVEAEKTVMATTVETGTYQINFFQRIRNLIILARKRLQESQHWLELFHTRQNQRSYYWGQVGKSGAKYMLSHERYMATQAG
jgi:hypothetical protein